MNSSKSQGQNMMPIVNNINSEMQRLNGSRGN